MKFLKKLRSEGKETFLGLLREQLRQLALSELASGKLASTASLDEVSNRVLPVFRRNPLTASVLKSFRVTDEDLRELLRNVLIDVGVELT